MQTNFELKRYNTEKVFHALQDAESLSRKELCRRTGLSWGSISAIVGDLTARGIAVAEKIAPSGGRPADLLALSPTGFLQIGIDINSVGLTFVVVGLGGQTVLSKTVPIRSRSKDDLIAVLLSETESILRGQKGVIGINLSMQGKINRRTGISVRTNFFTDWKDVPLIGLFEEKFHLPTGLYHDPDCLLYYHLRTDPRLKGGKDGFVLRLDDGIGMARLVAGKLYERGEETSYELGHTLTCLPSPVPRRCACGKTDCLEAYASLRGMKEIYAERSGRAPEAFVPALQAEDPVANGVLSEGAKHLGAAIANLFTLSSPDFILLDGKLFSVAPTLFDEIEAHALARTDGVLLHAEYRPESPAVGACLIATEKNTEKILFGS